MLLCVGVWPFGLDRQCHIDQPANGFGATWFVGLSLSPSVDCCSLPWQQPHHYWFGAHKRSSATALFSNIGY